MTLLQASAVAVRGRCVLLTGAPGSGKSSLALALVDRGAELIGDDGVTLERRGDTLLASPPPAIAGKLEVRGVGLIDLPTTSAPVALIVALGEDGERLPDALPAQEIAGIRVPVLRLAAADWTTPLRMERALELHGLDVAAQP